MGKALRGFLGFRYPFGRVMIGDGQYIQPLLRGQVNELGRRKTSIRKRGVGMQVNAAHGWRRLGVRVCELRYAQ